VSAAGAPAGGCAHLTVEDDVGGCRWRWCVVCGVGYDRGAVLARLQETIRERHRLPPSPWTSAERAADLWS
jgi:hypothetical protein